MAQGRILLAMVLEVVAIAAASDKDTIRYHHRHGRSHHHFHAGAAGTTNPVRANPIRSNAACTHSHNSSANAGVVLLVVISATSYSGFWPRQAAGFSSGARCGLRFQMPADGSS